MGGLLGLPIPRPATVGIGVSLKEPKERMGRAGKCTGMPRAKGGV